MLESILTVVFWLFVLAVILVFVGIYRAGEAGPVTGSSRSRVSERAGP